MFAQAILEKKTHGYVHCFQVSMFIFLYFPQAIPRVLFYSETINLVLNFFVFEGLLRLTFSFSFYLPYFP